SLHRRDPRARRRPHRREHDVSLRRRLLSRPLPRESDHPRGDPDRSHGTGRRRRAGPPPARARGRGGRSWEVHDFVHGCRGGVQRDRGARHARDHDRPRGVLPSPEAALRGRDEARRRYPGVLRDSLRHGGTEVIQRVVVTGLGVVAPNGNGILEFEAALRSGTSGIRAQPKLAELGFGSRVAGVPQGVDELVEKHFDEELQRVMNSSHRYAAVAAIDAWRDAGLARPNPGDDAVDWDSGAVIGTGIGALRTIGGRVVPLADAGKGRRLGSTAVEQVMASGVSARVSGLLALGNQVTTNSSACSTGAEAIAIGLERIRRGQAKRMLCGGAEGESHYIWAGFDAMRVLCRTHNDAPELASRPMSGSAAGFVAAAGAGVLLLESEESARERGARIYAEVAGTGLNCGGHRGGGSMTAPNPEAVQRCIRLALDDAGVA